MSGDPREHYCNVHGPNCWEGCPGSYLYPRPPTYHTYGPAKTAVKCPLCEGKGTLGATTQTICAITCHGCQGRGWVAV